MEEELQKVVEEIEAEQLLGRVSAVSVFRSLLNQPDLLALSSVDADPSGSANGFSSFQITLPRPMLEVDALQLVHANIPQCVQNIPDTACVFWYYRVSEYSGKTPNTENLFFVRLLPSYYKPEFFQTTPATYGQNKTFHSYQDLADELVLSCQRDLGDRNLSLNNIAGYDFRYLPNEITLPYNATINKFQMIGTNAQLQLAYKLWSSGTTYAIDDVVYQGTLTYKSLVAGNIGNNPTGVGASAWQLVNGEIVALYNSTTPYGIGRYVSFNNLLYRSIANVTGTAPPNATFWQLIVEDNQVNYRYLITGYSDPNVVALQGTGSRTWNSFALFETNAIVFHKGSSWSAVYQNVGAEPSVSPAWILSGTPAIVVGLNACSSEVDMLERGGTIGLLYPFPEGIPGQPFNPTPRRLLNSILGFTWNGIMTPAFLQSIVQIPFINFQPTEASDLINRLRPVPLYVTPRVMGGLGAELSTTTQTYTAEGYCNLVYSSILSIYANVMGGSTINTNQNTGLLGLSSMNAGNLGVSFYSQPIVQPLSINGSDIYTIGLYFEDEFGEPYFFTNNAVLSFMLKITYKNKIVLK